MQGWQASLCRQDSIWQKTRSCLTQIRHLGHCICSKDCKAWNHQARKGAHHICRRLDSYQYCSARFFLVSRQIFPYRQLQNHAPVFVRQYRLRHTADKNIFFKKPHGFVMHTLFQRLTVLITFANVFKQEFFTQKQCKLFEINKWLCPFCDLFSFL